MNELMIYRESDWWLKELEDFFYVLDLAKSANILGMAMAEIEGVPFEPTPIAVFRGIHEGVEKAFANMKRL